MQHDNYAAQHRGNESAYAAYFAGMDSSMQQKVALTTAFFPTRGRVADMGSGSGRGTFDLACLYPGLELIGVDINPVSVERARAQYVRPNLRYEVGDIADLVFPSGSLDGVLDSSVLHHVTSFNDFSLERLAACLRNQVDALRVGGVLIVRDFVIPDGPQRIELDLREDDGDGAAGRCSTAQLFERFAATFKSSVNRTGGVPSERLPPPRPGVARYRLALRDATEFILRKDYRADWDTELLEEYTYYSQTDFERRFRALGLRVLANVPIHNPWIIEHRYRGRIALWDEAGRALPFPATNYFIVGEKIAANQPIALEPLYERESATPRFFVPRSYRNVKNGEIYALAERPGRTLDVIPWFVRGGRVHVLAKKGFPRPLLTVAGAGAANGASGFITEPIAAITAADEPEEAAALRILRERAGVAPEAIRALSPCARYFTSPGALDECVDAVLVELAPDFEACAAPDYGDLGDSGSVRELDAAQLLRAAQVGGLFDARLEIGAYRALSLADQPVDAWIGAQLALPGADLDFEPECSAGAPSAGAVFEASPSTSLYLRILESEFVARAADGTELARAKREYVVPRDFDRRTVSVLPVLCAAGAVWVGIEVRALPAVQRFTGDAAIEVCPAFRQPSAALNQPELERHVCEQLEGYGVSVEQLTPLGGAYAPTSGATPEIVTPFAAVVTGVRAPRLCFAPLAVLLADPARIRDGHLQIAVLRLGHALAGVSAAGER